MKNQIYKQETGRALLNNTEKIKCQNDKEIIENQGLTIITTGRKLKEEVEKTKLLLKLFKNRNQLQSIIESLVECPECSKKVDEYLSKLETEKLIEENNKFPVNCIYFNECGECEKACDKYLESVV